MLAKRVELSADDADATGARYDANGVRYEAPAVRYELASSSSAVASDAAGGAGSSASALSFAPSPPTSPSRESRNSARRSSAGGSTPPKAPSLRETRKRSMSVPRHRRSRASVGDPLVGRRAPFLRMNASRAANERTWSCDISVAPLDATLTMPLLGAISDAFGHLPAPLPPLSSYVEAALRTATAGPGSTDWLTDLIDHLIAARPPAPLSEVAGRPLIESAADETFRRFSLSLPWVRVVLPELRHTTDCNTAFLRLDGISVDGVSIDAAGFKSAQRVCVDSLLMDIQPEVPHQDRAAV